MASSPFQINWYTTNVCKILLIAIVSICLQNQHIMTSGQETMMEKPGVAQSKNTYLITGPKIIRPGSNYEVSVQILDNIWQDDPTSFEISILALPLKTDNSLPRTIDFNDVVDASSLSGADSISQNDNATVVLGKATNQFLPGDAKIVQIPLPANLADFGSRRFVLNVKKTHSSETVTTSTLSHVDSSLAEKVGPVVPIINPFPSLREQTDLTFNDKVRSIFVQTDKAKYKPGDKVLYRILVLTPSLKPIQGSINIFISDPQDNRIRQMLNQKLSRGLFRSEFQLADKSPLGEWKIQITFIEPDTGNSTLLSSPVNAIGLLGNNVPVTTKSFTVEEYVLPTYDVKLSVPSYGAFDVQNKSVTVKGSFEAKYTFGGNVPGKATIVLKDSYGTYNATLGSVQYLQTQKELTIDERTPNIKHEFELTLEMRDNPQFSKSSFEYGHSFTVTLNFVDALTLKSKTAEGEVNVFLFPYEMTIVGPDFYKPGLAYTLRIFVTFPDGKPLLSPDDVTELVRTLRVLNGHENPRSGSYGNPNATADPETRSVINLTRIFDYNKRYINAGTFVKQLYEETLLELDEKGQAILILDAIDLDVTRVAFEARFMSQARTFYHSSSKFEEPADIYLELRDMKPSGHSKNILQLGSNHSIEARSSVPITNLTALFISKGKLVGVRSLNLGEPTKRIEIGFPVTLSLIPAFKVLAYFVTAAGNVIVDSIEYRVDRFSDNFVELKFLPGSDSKAQNVTFGNETSPVDLLTLKPRDSTVLNVKTNPEALVGLLAVDQSVRILATGNDLTSALVESELGSYDSSTPVGRPFGRGIYFPPYGRSGNAFQIFMSAGLVVLTDATLHQANEIVPRYGMSLAADFVSFRGGAVLKAAAESAPVPLMLADSVGAPSPAGPAIITRTEFPETWIWQDLTADSNGLADLKKVMPDTITTWVATALSIDDEKGLALSTKPAEVRVFQPFFVTLNLPFSIIRGEKVRIQALVYNYLGKDISAIVTLDPPVTNGTYPEPDFEILVADDFDNTVNRNERQPSNGGNQITIDKITDGAISSVFFYIRALRVGSIKLRVEAVSESAGDALEKLLIVKAEGEPRFFNQPILITLDGDKSTSFNEKFVVPWNVTAMVPASNYLEVSTIGDIMGPTLNNLGNLVRLPYGCGEQNMLNFAPNLYVYEYLRTKQLLTPALKNQIISFTERGYQRQLTYQRNDGSFSAFGKSDKDGSIWLTSFVLRSFVDASQKGLGLIYVDPKIIENALLFLLENQILPPLEGFLNPFKGDSSDIGSFKEVGEIHHKPLQGGASKGLALTAYVYISLRETANKYFANLTSYTDGSSQIKNPENLVRRLSTAILLAENFILKKVQAVVGDDYSNFPLPYSTYDLAIASYALTLASQTPLNTSVMLNIRYLPSGTDRSPSRRRDSGRRNIRQEPTTPSSVSGDNGTNVRQYFTDNFNADFNAIEINQTDSGSRVGGDVSIENLDIATHNTLVKTIAPNLLAKLLALNTTEGGTTFWQNVEIRKVSPCDPIKDIACRYEVPPSLDIETTAYIFLTLTTVIRDGNSNLELNQGLPVLNWLVRNRNALGGYSSTQDTIISLNALTTFASLLPPISRQDLTVTVQGETQSDDVLLKPDNLLVKHIVSFGSKLEKDINIVAKGIGTGLVQVSWSFNVIRDQLDRGFDLDVKSALRNNTILVTICMKYNLVGENKEGRSNMIVLEINAPSGFTIDKDSLVALENKPKVSELTDANTKLNLYFDSLGSRQECLKLNMEKLFEVKDIKPALVKLSDYYQPEFKQIAYVEFEQL